MAKGDIRSGSVSYNSATTAASSTNLQTYAVPGDLLMAILCTANEAGGNRPPTSFSEIEEVPGSPLGTGTPAAAGAVRGEVHVARFTAANENTVDWGDSGDVNIRLRWIIEGSWSAIPDIIGASTTSTGTTTLSFPSLSGVPAGAIVYHIVCSDRDSASTSNFSSWSSPDLASITEIHDQTSTTGQGGGIGAAGGIATAGGTVDGATVTAATSDTCILFSIAIPMDVGSADLTPNDVSVAVALDAAALTVEGDVVPNDVAVATTIDQPTLGLNFTITQPTDRGRVDLAASGLVIESGNPVLELGFLPSEDHDGGSTSVKALIMYARVQGVQGVANLRFKAKKHPTGGHYLRANGRLLWRETGSGWNGWQTFDSGSGGSGADKFGWNSSAFTVDDIEVVYGLPLPIGEHQGIVDGWAGTAYAVEPASSVGGGTYRCGTIGGTNFADDRTGGTLNGVSLYQRVIEMRDDSATPPAGRSKALLAMGTGLHASEDPFSYAHAFAVDEWINDAALRARFNLYLLPIMAPAGRYTGRWRGTSQIAARSGSTGTPSYIEGQDLNNDWDDTVVFSEEIHNLRVAIATDDVVARILASRGGWLDWHTDATGSNPDLFAYVGDPLEGMTGDVILPYADSHITATDYSIVTGTGPSATGTSRGWFENQGVRFSTTLESGGNVANYYALAEDVGRGTMQGLADAFDAGELGGYQITPADVAVAVALDSPTLASESSVSPADMAVAVSLDAAAVDTASSVSPADMAVAVAVDQPTLASVSAVSPADVAVAVALDVATLSADGDLLPADIAVAVALDSPTLAATTSVSPADMAVVVALDAAALTSGATLAVDDLNVAVAIDSPTLSAESAVSPNDMAVVVSLDQATLGQGGNRPPTRRRMNAGTWNRRIAA